MTERDYRKFVREVDGEQRLYVAKIPRIVYVEMVERWRGEREVIERVADAGLWLFDFKQAEEAAIADGREYTLIELSDEITAEMNDQEWWRVRSAFERDLIMTFPTFTTDWSDLLDPVYDQQERDGWPDKQ